MTLNPQARYFLKVNGSAYRSRMAWVRAYCILSQVKSFLPGKPARPADGKILTGYESILYNLM